jgi:hypothetical protein
VEWQKGHLIGKGAYAKVWNGLNLKDGTLLAIKEMKLTNKYFHMSDIDFTRHVRSSSSLLPVIVAFHHSHSDLGSLVSCFAVCV